MKMKVKNTPYPDYRRIELACGECVGMAVRSNRGGWLVTDRDEVRLTEKIFTTPLRVRDWLEENSERLDVIKTRLRRIKKAWNKGIAARKNALAMDEAFRNRPRLPPGVPLLQQNPDNPD